MDKTLGNLVNCVLIDKETHFVLNNIGNRKHLALGVIKDNVLVFLNTGTHRYKSLSYVGIPVHSFLKKPLSLILWFIHLYRNQVRRLRFSKVLSVESSVHPYCFKPQVKSGRCC